ncbi:MAG: hypothetical protein N2690_00790 [Rhodocyclaceae bacterium]|nr:hypothetical protein [Rhodocyclaceae bacterium]
MTALVISRRVGIAAKTACLGPCPGGRFFAAHPAGTQVDVVDYHVEPDDLWARAERVWASWLGYPRYDGTIPVTPWVVVPTPAHAAAMIAAAQHIPAWEDYESQRFYSDRWDVPGIGAAILQLYAVGPRIPRWVDRLDWRFGSHELVPSGRFDPFSVPLAERAAAYWRYRHDPYQGPPYVPPIDRWAQRCAIMRRKWQRKYLRRCQEAAMRGMPEPQW